MHARSFLQAGPRPLCLHFPPARARFMGFLGLYKVCKVLWAGCGVIRCWHGRALLLVPGCGNTALSREAISCYGCWEGASGEVVHRRENAAKVGEGGQKHVARMVTGTAVGCRGGEGQQRQSKGNPSDLGALRNPHCG